MNFFQTSRGGISFIRPGRKSSLQIARQKLAAVVKQRSKLRQKSPAMVDDMFSAMNSTATGKWSVLPLWIQVAAAKI